MEASLLGILLGGAFAVVGLAFAAAIQAMWRLAATTNAKYLGVGRRVALDLATLDWQAGCASHAPPVEGCPTVLYDGSRPSLVAALRGQRLPNEVSWTVAAILEEFDAMRLASYSSLEISPGAGGPVILRVVHDGKAGPPRRFRALLSG